MVYEEERGCVIKAAPIIVGTGEVDLAKGRENFPGVLVEVLRDIKRFMGVNRRIRNKVDKVECKCRITRQK